MLQSKQGNFILLFITNLFNVYGHGHGHAHSSHHSSYHYSSSSHINTEHESSEIRYGNLIRENYIPRFFMTTTLNRKIINSQLIVIMIMRNDHKINIYNQTDECLIELQINNYEDNVITNLENYIKNETMTDAITFIQNGSINYEYNNTINELKEDIIYDCRNISNYRNLMINIFIISMMIYCLCICVVSCDRKGEYNLM